MTSCWLSAAQHPSPLGLQHCPEGAVPTPPRPESTPPLHTEASKQDKQTFGPRLEMLLGRGGCFPLPQRPRNPSYGAAEAADSRHCGISCARPIPSCLLPIKMMVYRWGN